MLNNKDFDENKSHKKLFISFSYKRKSMLTALEWGYESDVIPNQSFRFVLKFIALEALLGDKKDIVETLKNRCAFLLAETHKEREELLTEIPKLYELRSKLVHGSGSLLGFENHEKLNNLNDILKRVIYSELFMLHGK